MSSREFFLKTNKWNRFYYYATCFRSFFGRDWRHQKNFGNYLSFRIQWKFQKFLIEFWLKVLSEKKLTLRLQYSSYRPTVLWDNLGNVLPTLKRSSKFLAFLIVLSWSRNQSLLRHTNKKENIVILLAAFLVRIPFRFMKNSLFKMFKSPAEKL